MPRRSPTAEDEAEDDTEGEATLADAPGVSFFSIGDQEFAVLALPGAPQESRSPLSPAETSVLAELVAGRSTRDIAATRGTSERTVTNQVTAIFKKLGVRSRSELALLLTTRGTT